MRFFLFSIVFFAFVGFITQPFVVHAASIESGFQSIRSQAVWPVQGTNVNHIASTFGPRIKYDEQRYDWHRGVDIPAPEGTEVYAAYSGTLHQITTYPEGGLTVVIKHRLPQAVDFHSTSTHVFYSFSMHLSNVDAQLKQAYDLGQKPFIQAGDRIGYVGSSGEGIETQHLHFELRLGTPCSFEYQLANPTSSCARGFGFDPHIHPLHLLSSIQTNTSITQVQSISQGMDGVFQIQTTDFSPGLNQFETVFFNDNDQVVYQHILNLDTREGFDARTVSALDLQDVSKPYLEPILFNVTSTVYEIRYRIPFTVFTRLSHVKRMVVRVRDYLGAVQEYSLLFSVVTGCPFEVGSLYKLESDLNPMTQHDTAVYYYGKDCKRHAFPNENTYFTWYQDFSSVKEVAPSLMASMSLGANIRYKPGSTLVKLMSVPDVYAVTGYGELEWVSTENEAIRLFGVQWAKRVFDLSDAFAMDYRYSKINPTILASWSALRNSSWQLP